MKRGTPDHPKVGDLAMRLNIPEPYALGLLAKMWEWVSKYTPSGDIGKYSDAIIASKLGWPEEPARLIRSLIDSRWLDENKSYRLVVHDWAQHCEDSVHAQLARQGLLFADLTKPKLKKLTREEQAAAEKKYAAENGGQIPPTAACLSPSLTLPKPKPSPDAPAAAADEDEDPQVLSRELVDEIHPKHPQLCSRESARTACVLELAKYPEQSPRKLCAAWRVIHAEHCDRWRLERERNSNSYVPHLHKWFLEGIYLQSKTNCIPPQSEKRGFSAKEIRERF
jgi:hypothetical protein